MTFLDEEDDFTEEEKLALEAETDLPPPDEEDEDAPAFPTEPEAAADKPDPDPADKPEEQEVPDGFARFQDMHKDKSAEELLRIAYQQNAARSEARGQQKESEANLNSLMQRITQTREAKSQEVAARREAFNQELRDDPDAATQRLHDDMLNREEQDAEAAQWNEYVGAQTQMTRNAIHDFDNVAPQLMSFAVEGLGYTPEMVQQAHDHRDILALNMARQFSNIANAWETDPAGNLALNEHGQPVPRGGQTQQPVANTQANDTLSRIENTPANPASSLSSARGNPSPSGPKSLQKRAEEMLAMPDAEFGQLDDKELDKLLEKLG